MNDSFLSGELSGFASDSPETGGRTLVEGSTFVVSGRGGDISGDGPEGLFVRDARVLSRWQLSIDGQDLEPLAGFSEEPFCGVFVARAQQRAGEVEPTLLVSRRRYVGGGMREDIALHNYGPEPAGAELTLSVGCDLADLFEVKRGHVSSARTVTVEHDLEKWTASGRHGGQHRSVAVTASGASVSGLSLTWQAVVPAHGQWETSVEVITAVDGTEIPPRFPIGFPIDEAGPVEGIAEWRRASPTLDVESPALLAAFARSQTDLSALRITDPSAADAVAVAAGAPWFMALFGRDALITSAMTMAVNPDLAVGTLRALAQHQGQVEDPMTEEQPGRIIHELRLGADEELALGGSDRYYGSVDATPLFVMVLGQLARWGARLDIIEELLPAADRALAWIADYGDRDGDGFVEYLRSTDRGLRNQGWKDSHDGINFADGTIAEPPIALVEVQGYVYGAYRARAALAALQNDKEACGYWNEQASRMRRRIDDAFWLPDAGYYAVGLDRDKRPIDSLASNMGHLLWAGAAEPARAGVAAERLVSAEMFNGYGVRTLATTMGAYNPVSYHNGSVWPHDTALAVAGMVGYGFHRPAQRIAAGLIDAAGYFSGRLPELFCGFGKAEFRGPVPYPNACAPQAWASAAPVAAIVAMLGLDPDVPAGTVGLNPAVPPAWGRICLTDIPLGQERLTINVHGDGTWYSHGAPTLRRLADDQTAPAGR